MSGRPLELNWENDNAGAILLTWFAGHEAGNAIADVLFGNYNPSGKLTMTFPRNVGQVPVYYNHKNTGRPASRDFQKFQSNYLDVSNEPLFPFGYGLSYTSFEYSNIQLSDSTMTAGKSIKATVTITNSGNYDGEETVQMYIFDPVASVAQPVKKLKGFQKIFLKKGESRQVTFTISIDELKFYNARLQYIAEPGDFKVYIGGNSRDVKEASFALK
jgi:beta-glucosidase